MLPFLGKLEEVVSFFLKLIPFGFAEYNKSTLNVFYRERSGRIELLKDSCYSWLLCKHFGSFSISETSIISQVFVTFIVSNLYEPENHKSL